MYESTGLKGQSKVRSINYKSGLVINEKKLNKNYFGEGLSLLNNKVYSLYKNSNQNDKNLSKVTNSYKTLTKKSVFLIGFKFYKSDGTNKIWTNKGLLIELGIIRI